MHVSMLMALTLALAAAVPARAADLQVIAGGGIAVPLNEIVAQFEQSSGHKVTIRYGTAPELIKIATTTPFDFAVTPSEVFKDEGAAARLVWPDDRHRPRRSRRGGPSGAPKPDIGTPEALKQALLAAKTVATIPASAAGAQVMKLFEQLGVASEVKAKLQAAANPVEAGRDHGRRPGRDRHLHHQRADGQRHGRGRTGAGRARLRADLYQRHRARRCPAADRQSVPRLPPVAAGQGRR